MMKRICIIIIKAYQKSISPILPNSCRFFPTCSEYSIQAFEKYGFFKGFRLTIKRLLRCNPFCEGGFDPLP